MSFFGQLGMYLNFALGLKGFLKEPINEEQCWLLTKQRLENRERNLLDSIRYSVYANNNSPYLKLLKHAGCEYGDFKKLVYSEGVEAALSRIKEAGVYITIEEFKGKQPATRGRQTFYFGERDFDNPFLAGHLRVRTGASRSAGTRTIYDFKNLEENWAVHQIMRYSAYNALGYPTAMWLPIMPGAGPVALLGYTKAGIILDKWFSPINKKKLKPSLKNRLGTDYIIYTSRLFGTKLPKPEYVAIDEAWKIAAWMSDAIRTHGGCCLATYVSSAVRICQAAREMDLDLKGAVFSVSSEPFTAAKKKGIEASGAMVHSMYAFMEAGIVGLECANPTVTDDNHLLSDCFALIQRPREIKYAEVTVDAFLFTSLLKSSPKVLLNVENGDYGVIESRSCGCKLEKAGFGFHLHSIRGFDKLTGEGMSFVGSDIIRIIEEALPSRFGGNPNMYQMVEEEDEKGQTHLYIIVSPEVGEIDEDALLKFMLAELSKGKDTQRLMAEIWAKAKTMRVKRTKPMVTTRGKLLPLHICNKSK
jgi:hypothetical protein